MERYGRFSGRGRFCQASGIGSRALERVEATARVGAPFIPKRTARKEARLRPAERKARRRGEGVGPMRVSGRRRRSRPKRPGTETDLKPFRAGEPGAGRGGAAQKLLLFLQEVGVEGFGEDGVDLLADEFQGRAGLKGGTDPHPDLALGKMLEVLGP